MNILIVRICSEHKAMKCILIIKFREILYK